MKITSDQPHFFISYTTVFIAFGFIGTCSWWPTTANRDDKTALTPLLVCACLRVYGPMFLRPEPVAPALPKWFAVLTAYGM